MARGAQSAAALICLGVLLVGIVMWRKLGNLSFFKNSMRPDWILTGDWEDTPENVEALRQRIRKL